MTEPLGLSTYRWNNNIKSMLLLAAFPCLLLGLVSLFFWITGLLQSTPKGFVSPILANSFGLPEASIPPTPVGFMLAATISCAPVVFAIAAGWIVIGSLFNEGLIRMATGARPIARNESPDLYNVLENLCISRGMIMPKLFIIDTPIMNAYASGLSKASFSITVTRGLMEALSKDELEAVLAHELTHIRNRDVRLLVVTVLFGGMLSFFAEMAWRSIRFSSMTSHSDNDGERRKGSGALLIIAALVLAFGYILSMLLRLALSRRREYLADAGSVELTKNPGSLIRALQKISGHAAMPDVPSGVQAMLIENPPGVFSLFATHPPIEDRIAVLRRLDGQPEEGHSILPNTR
ncbi:MAG: M48 family metallopeptidase [Alphaproteobacteria bacterium]|nr:M48 family metallopeptidase [Alphaproteobacteria bacterium]